MSFNDTQDQGSTDASDQLTFKVGDREFNAEAAAKKIESADGHINKIESENATYISRIAELEAKVSQSVKLEDALAKLEANKASTQESQSTSGTAEVSEEQIGAIATRQIEDYLAERQAKKQLEQAENVAKTTYEKTGEELTIIYGDKVDDAMAAKAEELGITKEAIFDLAKNPVTAKMLVDSMRSAPPSPQSAPLGGINTAGSHHHAPEKLVDYSGDLTSSVIGDALKKAGATY